MTSPSAGRRLRQNMAKSAAISIVGTPNAYTALMATKLGHQAIYLSGAGCANVSFGLPDLGMTGAVEVLEDARRITAAVETPLVADIDTGWGGMFNIARTVRQFCDAGVAAVHIEDQVAEKRCGHRPNKSLVSANEMCDRIAAAVDARPDADFFIIARTDAYALEGLDASIERAQAYVEAGADAIFAEAMSDLSEYEKFTGSIDVPLLANMTEFGVTPLYEKEQLVDAGVRMLLYPLSATRAMHKAAENVYTAILQDGHQKRVLNQMQTREELYDYLNYHSYEQQIDEFNRK